MSNFKKFLSTTLLAVVFTYFFLSNVDFSISVESLFVCVLISSTFAIISTIKETSSLTEIIIPLMMIYLRPDTITRDSMFLLAITALALFAIKKKPNKILLGLTVIIASIFDIIFGLYLLSLLLLMNINTTKSNKNIISIIIILVIIITTALLPIKVIDGALNYVVLVKNNEDQIILFLMLSILASMAYSNKSTKNYMIIMITSLVFGFLHFEFMPIIILSYIYVGHKHVLETVKKAIMAIKTIKQRIE